MIKYSNLLPILMLLSVLFDWNPNYYKKSDEKIPKKSEISSTFISRVYYEKGIDYSEDSVVVFRIVKNDSFMGFVFPKERGLVFSPSKNRYTLYNSEISLAEMTIDKNIRLLNSILASRKAVDPYSHPPYLSYKKLRKYYRQYIGYECKDGDILVRIFFIKYPHPPFEDDIAGFHMWMDGGQSYDYFDITVNIKEKTLMLTPSNINDM